MSQSRLWLLLFFLVFLPVPAHAQSFLAANERYAGKHATLKSLVDEHANPSGNNSAPELGVLDAPLPYGAVTTVPVTLSLDFRGAGQIDCGSSGTTVVTIQSAVTAPDVLIFKNCPATALSFTGSPQKVFKVGWFDTPTIAAAVLPAGAVLDSTVTPTFNSAGPPAANSCRSDHEFKQDTTNHQAYFCDTAGATPINFASLGDGITEVDTDDAVAVHAVGDTAVAYGGADASISSEGNNTTKTVKFRSKVLSHATDCPNNVTGKANQLCIDLDDYRTWICKPTSGDCNTAAEWRPANGTTVAGAQGQTAGIGHCTEVVPIDNTGLSTYVTTSCLIPANATVTRVPVYVIATVGGTPTLTVRATTSGTYFQAGTGIATTATTSDPGNKPGPASYSGVAQQSVTLGLSANPSDTAGQVRVDIWYETFTPATS